MQQKLPPIAKLLPSL